MSSHGSAVDSHKTRVKTVYGVYKQCLKLESHKLLSNFGFEIKLRRYMKAELRRMEGARVAAEACGGVLGMLGGGRGDDRGGVGWCRLTVSKPVLKARMVSALEARI